MDRQRDRQKLDNKLDAYSLTEGEFYDSLFKCLKAEHFSISELNALSYSN